MGNDLARKVQVGVNLPGSPGIVHEIPEDLYQSNVDKVIKYVLQRGFSSSDAPIVKAISKEINGATYTVFVSLGNEQYRVNGSDQFSELLEKNQPSIGSQYQKLNFTVSKPRTGGN
jgi:hypothetical protein